MKASIFGQRIAHGLLVLSIQQGLLGRAMPECAGSSLIALKWKFRGPIKIGDTVRVRARVTAVREGEKPEWGVVAIERRVLNQRGEVVQEGMQAFLLKRKPAG